LAARVIPALVVPKGTGMPLWTAACSSNLDVMILPS
jgi:hypothetical protein